MINSNISFSGESSGFQSERESKSKQEQQYSAYYKSPQQTPTFQSQAECHLKINPPVTGGRGSIYFKNENPHQDIFSVYQSLRHISDLSQRHRFDSTQNVLPINTDEAITLLETPHDQRRTKEIRQLRNYFQEFEFFKKLLALEGQDFTNQCIDNLSHKPCKQQSLLFNSSLGEIEPDLKGIMILLKGECGLKYSVGQKCNFEESSKVISEGFTMGAYELEQDNVRQNLKKVYTIICDVDCNYVYLDKQIYSHLKLQKVRHDKRDQIEFFKTISIFKNFEEMTLVEVLLQCEYQTFNRMQYVYKEGEESNYVYFIFQGEFRLKVQKQNSKIIDQTKLSNKNKNNTQSDKVLKNNVPQQFTENDHKHSSKQLLQQNSFDEDNSSFHNQKLKDLYSLMLAKTRQEQMQKQEQITLIIYQQGNLFGDLEILEEIQGSENITYIKQRKNRIFSVQCMSDQGVCFKISNFKFRKLISQHRQILAMLIEQKQTMSNWISNRVGQIQNSKILTKQVLQSTSGSKVLQKKNSIQRQQDEVKAKLLEQHKAATKYLEESLVHLQQRIKRDEKERHKKVFDMAKELSKMRENRHHLLQTQLQLKEKKKKEQDTVKLESPKKDSLLILNMDDQIQQATLHSQTPRHKRGSLLSRQSDKQQSDCSSPQLNERQNVFSFEEQRLQPQYNSNLSPSSNFSLTKRPQVYDKNSAPSKNEIQLKNFKINKRNHDQSITSPKNASQTTKSLRAGSVSPWKIKEQTKRESIFKDNEKQKLYLSQDLDYDPHNNRRVISYLKKELQMEQFPQLLIKSSIPINTETNLTNNQQTIQVINSINSCQTDNTITLEDANQSQIPQKEYLFSRSYQKLKINSLHENKSLQSPQSKTLTDILLKNNVNSTSSKQLNQSNQRSSIMLKQITSQTERSYHQNIQDKLSTKVKTNNFVQISPSITSLAAQNQNINSNLYQVDSKEFTNLYSKPRSITNYEQKLSLEQLERKQSKQMNQTNEINRLDLTFNADKPDNLYYKQDFYSTKSQKLPLKYFVPQYKTLQKHHRGIINYNNTITKPVNTDSIKLISPRLFAS